MHVYRNEEKTMFRFRNNKHMHKIIKIHKLGNY